MDNESIQKIKEYVKSLQSEKRYTHTLGVFEDTKKMCDLFGLTNDKADKLCCAALLHDVTKEMPASFHKEICEKNGIVEPESGYDSPTIHAISGSLLAAEKFPNIIGEVEKNAIRFHTTGKESMTIEEMIICFADYIEPNRKYEGCKKLRNKFYSNINFENRLELLQECLRDSFEMTISSLSQRKSHIDKDTLNAKNYLDMVLERR